MTIYGFWNNKGGTGKTSLAFQAACFYASAHPQDRVLVIDMCPQANMSELLLGGLGNGGNNLLSRQGQTPRASIGGYFQMRLPSPYEIPEFSPQDFITTPHRVNGQIPTNLDLVCGDALLELQANAMFTLANTQIPGTNTWICVVDWLRDFIEPIRGSYRAIFVDSNPSFSLYTQIALATVDELVLPVMADGSSRRGLQNAFSLIHGLKLPSPIYAEHNFATRMRHAGRGLPITKMIVKNRITQYMGDASGYAAVLRLDRKRHWRSHEDKPQDLRFRRPRPGDTQCPGLPNDGSRCLRTRLPHGSANGRAEASTGQTGAGQRNATTTLRRCHQ